MLLNLDAEWRQPDRARLSRCEQTHESADESVSYTHFLTGAQGKIQYIEGCADTTRTDASDGMAGADACSAAAG
jgi:hypothetical protein